jgi:hypothetical protein
VALIYAQAVAARRLIIFMLALLVLSSIAAALVPIERQATRDTTTTAAAAPPAPTGRSIEAKVDADAGRPKRIAIRLGDSLGLTVSSQSPALVEVVGLGLTDDVDPNAPARFDLRPYERGSYPVRLVGDRRIGLIEVGPRRRT